MDIERLIDKHQLNDSEAAVLRFMEKNREHLRRLGVRQVAKETFVSAATIINMSKKLGFSGYSELVFAFLNTAHHLQEPQSFTEEEKNQFIQLLQTCKEKRMMVLGSGFSQNLANYISEYLNLYGFRATANSHLEFLRENVSKDILIFMISNSGETVRLVELAQMAKDHRIPLIAFVGERDSKIGKLATLTISTETYAPQALQKFAPNLFFGTALNQFEFLMSATLQSIFLLEE